MFSTSSAIDYYLGLCREGRHDEAFFGLLELDHDVLPPLMEAYRAEPDVEIRALLIGSNLAASSAQRRSIPCRGPPLS